MRVLLDECVDHRLEPDLVGHEVSTAARMGWRGKANGELLGLAAHRFDAFVTTDRKLSFQQNHSKLNLTIVVLRARTHRLSDLLL